RLRAHPRVRALPRVRREHRCRRRRHRLQHGEHAAHRAVRDRRRRRAGRRGGPADRGPGARGRSRRPRRRRSRPARCDGTRRRDAAPRRRRARGRGLTDRTDRGRRRRSRRPHRLGAADLDPAGHRSAHGRRHRAGRTSRAAPAGHPGVGRAGRRAGTDPADHLPLYGLSVVLAAYLQARRRFLWPAMMPLLSSVTVMISYRVYAHLVPAVATSTTISQGAVWWLGWGTTAGVAAMALPVLVAALRSGLRLRPTFTMPPGIGRRALALGGAGLGAVGAQQLVLALVMLLAMRAGGVGTLPVFQYGQALYLLPYSVLVVPLVTSVFPHLSELRLVGDRAGFAKIAAAS